MTDLWIPSDNLLSASDHAEALVKARREPGPLPDALKPAPGDADANEAAAAVALAAVYGDVPADGFSGEAPDDDDAEDADVTPEELADV